MKYKPGSFSKHFAWKNEGLSKLHGAIINGFGAELKPVDTQLWRQQSGVNSPALELIPLNFFLYKASQSDGSEVVSVDELVLHSVNRPHSSAFDRLALFAFHLSRGGASNRRREGRASLWANKFVRDLLWQDGAWRARSLQRDTMHAFITANVRGKPRGLTKVLSNYRNLFELCDFIPPHTEAINTGPSSWAVSALFLAWDRLTLDGELSREASVTDLVAAAASEELYKLIGITIEEGEQLSIEAAELYLSAGGLTRTAAHAPFLSELQHTQTSTAVGRANRNMSVQKRNKLLAERVKSFYKNHCMFCGMALQVGQNPDECLSNAAHIKPLGSPHDGPDVIENMIVLCPNHHAQFDGGVLRIQIEGKNLIVVSSIKHHPCNGFMLSVNPEHFIAHEFIEWHFEYTRPIETRVAAEVQGDDEDESENEDDDEDEDGDGVD